MAISVPKTLRPSHGGCDTLSVEDEVLNVGQRVVLIMKWEEPSCIPPPIGSLGEITALEPDGDYLVLFPEWPCPHGEPDWITPPWAIIPIDDGESVKPREQTVSA